MRYGMIIDTSRCFGCQTCVISCKLNNEIPGDIHWNQVESLDGDVIYQATGIFPNVRLAFRPTLCNHCETPLCAASCPTGAMAKDKETGIVLVDYVICIGCGGCVEGCPYSIPVLDEISNSLVVSKCTFCKLRIENDKAPYCVDSCPGLARFFGDLDDPTSDVSKLIAKGSAEQWMPEKETNPSVYYLV